MPHPFAQWIDPINLWFIEHQWAAYLGNAIWIGLWIWFFALAQKDEGE